MEEYAIFQDYQRVMLYNEQQRRQRVIDPEEMEYWRKVFKDEIPDFKPEPENEDLEF